MLRHVLWCAKWGFEVIAVVPEYLRAAISRLLKLHGVDLFLSAIAYLLLGGLHRVVIDNLGCVCITGCSVAPMCGRLQGVGRVRLERLPHPRSAAHCSDPAISAGHAHVHTREQGRVDPPAGGPAEPTHVPFRPFPASSQRLL